MLRWSILILFITNLAITADGQSAEDEICEVPEVFDAEDYFNSAKASTASEHHYRSVITNCPLTGEVSHLGMPYKYIIHKTGVSVLYKEGEESRLFFFCERCGHFDEFFVDGADSEETPSLVKRHKNDKGP